MHFDNYKWFITQTVESMLPRFSDESIVLAMKLDMQWNYYPENENEESKKFRKEFLIAFHRPHNYTKVLLCDTTEDRQFAIQNRTYNMTKVSDHDSCWKEDGLNFIFKTFCQAWDFFEQFEINGRKIDPMIHWSIFSDGIPSYYKAELIKNSEQQWGKIPYIVKFGDKIPMCEISQYMPKRD